jgi:tetratricopeptide (TPR) repeat protein
MPISPYANCPCGSGKQFKWCCQPYYSFVERALHQLEQKQPAVAEQTVAQLVERFPNVPQAWGYQAQVLFLNNKLEEADAVLQRAFDLDPNFAFGHWLRGLMRLEEGEPVGALMLFRKTAELLDANAKEIQAQVHSRIAELELQFNRPVAARAAMDRALHFAPQAQELRQAFDSVFGSESRLPEVARRAYSLRQITGRSPDEWVKTLESTATGKLTDALKAFEPIAESSADNPAAWFNLGLIRAWLGDNHRAVEAINRSIDLETDEPRAEDAGALTEVLRMGLGMELETDYLEHRAFMQVREADSVGKALNDWGQSGRMIVVNADREQGIFSALILEDTPDLGVGVGTPVARLQSYMVLDGHTVRFWHSSRTTLDRTVDEFRGKVTVAVTEPQYDVGSAQFGDVVAEVMLFPTRDGADPEQVDAKMRDRAREFFEDTWIRRYLKSLGGATPLDAAGHPTARKRLPGVIRFMQECLGGAAPRADGQPSKPLYDFDRLRRKLGLTAGISAVGAEIDFDTMSAASLGGVSADMLSDEQVGQAFRAALRLDAPDLASGFARQAAGRISIADRYPFFNHLIRSARDEGKSNDVLRLLGEAEHADTATNGGLRAIDYGLARGQALARSGDVAGAYAAFKEIVTRSPKQLRLFGPAAESMLGKKEGAKAMEFAEAGLKEARAQNNRDAEQQFLELTAAAKKQTG